jgi:two-component system response regulator FixJ
LHGFQVEDHASGGEFLERVRSCDASCLLIDLYMPEMDGVELLNALERQGIALPVIMLTGRPDSPRAKCALQAGACAVLSKPVPERILLQAISAAMEGALAPENSAVVAANQRRSGNRVHTIP